MRIKLKFLLLIPLAIPLMSCSKSDKITFKCGSLTLETYYNDEYFSKNNFEYREDIALASHAMALATFNSDEDYSKHSTDLRDLWNKEGFSNIWMNDSFYEEPGTDTIGFGIASKKIQLLGGYYYLVAIAVRGGSYGAEWTSNFTIGTEGNAKGFDEASDLVIKGLSDYLTNNEIEGHVKIWISGFSRAAITSNLVAGKLLKNMNAGEYITNKVHYDSRDFYAYCFEPPLGAYISDEEAHNALYNGIHNMINYNDLVPLVAPYEWGFRRYGTDHYYPDRLTDIYFDESEREKLISNYHFTWGAQDFAKYTVDEWKFFDVGGEYAEIHNLPRESIHPSQGRFSRALIHEIAVTGFGGSRAYYAYLLEPGLRDLLSTVMGKNEKIDGIDTTKVIDIIFEYAFIKSMINELENGKSNEFALDAQMLFLQLFGANDDNLDAIKALYYDNFLFLNSFAEGLKNRQDVVTQLLYRDNAMNLVIGHMPELSYSFLSSCDTRLHGENACKFNDGTYQVMHIDSPRNFSLFEKNISKNVFTFQDNKMSSDHLAAERYHDGSIDIYLPNNGEYEYIGEFGNLTLYKENNFGVRNVIEASLPLNGTISNK